MNVPYPLATGNIEKDLQNIFIYLQTLSLTKTNEILTGTIFLWPQTTSPLGNSQYLKLSNQAVSRINYAALFALMGITFGAGDGSTTFNLPPAPSTVTNCCWIIHT